jgi:uncharacterized RDD family membrane protein YckC
MEVWLCDACVQRERNRAALIGGIFAFLAFALFIVGITFWTQPGDPGKYLPVVLLLGVVSFLSFRDRKTPERAGDVLAASLVAKELRSKGWNETQDRNGG